MNVEPSPGVDSTVMDPWKAVIIFLTYARPSPKPFTS